MGVVSEPYARPPTYKGLTCKAPGLQRAQRRGLNLEASGLGRDMRLTRATVNLMDSRVAYACCSTGGPGGRGILHKEALYRT